MPKAQIYAFNFIKQTEYYCLSKNLHFLFKNIGSSRKVLFRNIKWKTNKNRFRHCSSRRPFTKPCRDSEINLNPQIAYIEENDSRNKKSHPF